jgi:hypothetical protein
MGIFLLSNLRAQEHQPQLRPRTCATRFAGLIATEIMNPMDRPQNDKKHVRFPDHYTWLVLVASLDILLTYVVLHLGGLEANPLAEKVVYRWGVPGMVIYKFCFIVIAIVIAEEVGRRKERTARKFIEYAIVISAFPVIFALVLLALN